DRNHQAIGGVDRDADVVELLQDQAVLLRRQRTVEVGKTLQGRHARLHQERQQRHPITVGLGGGVQLLAVLVEVGDVRLVVVRDVWNVQPRSVQERPGYLLDSRERVGLPRTELREVLRRDLRNAHTGGGGGRRGSLGGPAQKAK